MRPLKRAVPVALLLVLACQNARPPAIPSPAPSAGPQVLRVAVASLPRTLDPALAPVYDSGASRLMFEALVAPRPDLSEVVPAAASGWVLAADSVTYDFQLRPGQRWSDGRPLRGADFVFAWRRLLDPRVNAPAGEVLSPLIKGAGAYFDLDPKKDAGRIPAFLDGLGISAPDDGSFRVVLDHPSAEFLWAAAMPATAPERADSPHAGNGPFRLVAAGGEQMTFERNEYYPGSRSGLARIVLFSRGDPASDLQRFGRGDEELTSVAPESAAEVARSAALAPSLVRTPSLAVWWIQFNVHRAPFDRPAVRQALARAIDREALVTSLLKGTGRAATSLLPAGLPAHRAGLTAQAFDPAQARAGLDGAGAAPADLGTIHMLVRDLAADRALADFVAAQLRQNLGLAITLDVQPSPAVTRKLASGDFQLAGPAGWIADLADAQDFLDLFVSEVFRGQASRYSNPAFDKLVAAGDGETNPVRRNQDYGQAEQLLAEDAPVVFLYQPETLALRAASVLGLRTTPLDDWPGDLFAKDIAVASR